MPTCLGRTSPNPRLGSMVELNGDYPCGLLTLVGVGKTLSRKAHRGGRVATSPTSSRSARTKQEPCDNGSWSNSWSRCQQHTAGSHSAPVILSSVEAFRYAVLYVHDWRRTAQVPEYLGES